MGLLGGVKLYLDCLYVHFNFSFVHRFEALIVAP